jgi:hypothetical protein
VIIYKKAVLAKKEKKEKKGGFLWCENSTNFFYFLGGKFSNFQYHKTGKKKKKEKEKDPEILNPHNYLQL